MPQFIPFEFPTSSNGNWIIGLDNAGVFRSRREQLGLTQQEVADRAKVTLTLYQSIESGDLEITDCDFKAALAVCAVLMLNPAQFLCITSDGTEVV